MITQSEYVKVQYVQAYHLVRLMLRAHAQNDLKSALFAQRALSLRLKKFPVETENAFRSFTAKQEAK